MARELIHDVAKQNMNGLATGKQNKSLFMHDRLLLLIMPAPARVSPAHHLFIERYSLESSFLA